MAEIADFCDSLRRRSLARRVLYTLSELSISRRARFTVLELGASPTAWVANRGLGTDDWLVVAQQSDEPAGAFSERAQRRARRLGKSASIELIDVYTAEACDEHASLARRAAIEALGGQLVRGGRLTLWSPGTDDAGLAAILAHFGPVLAERQIDMSHQSCEEDEVSGVRHASPIGGARSSVHEFRVEHFA